MPHPVTEVVADFTEAEGHKGYSAEAWKERTPFLCLGGACFLFCLERQMLS